eukprot:gene490-10168_t
MLFRIAKPVEFYQQFLGEYVRPDGRGLEEFKKTLLNIDSISTAEGSALVKLGNTTVLCGIKAEIAQPSLDAPNGGFIVSSVELPPLCSAKFRPGPPSEQAQVLTQFLIDTANSSSFLKPESLCIAQGKAVWCLYADVICLNYDGNIQDAALFALLAAMHNCSLPSASYSEETGETVVSTDKKSSLDIASNPIASTFAVFQNSQVVADPTEEEEGIADTVITIVTLEDNSLCSVYKPGGLAIKDDIFRQCIDRALSRGQELRQTIEKLTANIDR